METKNEKKAQKPTAKTLQKRYLSLSPREQLGVTNFFNMHNAAHFIYDGLSEDAQQYVNYCIRLSVKADKIEKENEKSE